MQFPRPSLPGAFQALNMTRRACLGAAFAAVVLAVGGGELNAQDGDRGPDPLDDQRVVVVTGSTGGLGSVVARRLGAQGDFVVIHGRNAERGQEVVREIRASGGSARFYRADLADYDDISAMADALVRDLDRIDVLVNNAGIALIDTPNTRRVNEDGYELHFQINYLAHFLLTERLMPLILASDDARIVNVSSLSAAPLDFDNLMLEEGYSTGRAYGQSKLAQVMHAMELAAELDDVTVNALHPETYMNTDMVLEAGLEPRSSVETGADNVMQLVNDPAVGTGLYYVDGEAADAHEQAYDARVRERLMEVSRELTGLPAGR